MIGDDDKELVSKWYGAKHTLAECIRIERELRDAVVLKLADQKTDSGTEKFDLGDGYTLKIERKLNYTLVADENKLIDAIDKLSCHRKEIVNWSPHLSLTYYKKLTSDDQAKLNGVVTIKPAAPVVTVIQPKESE